MEKQVAGNYILLEFRRSLLYDNRKQKKGEKRWC